MILINNGFKYHNKRLAILSELVMHMIMIERRMNILELSISIMSSWVYTKQTEQ